MIHLHDAGSTHGSESRSDLARRASLAKQTAPDRAVATQRGQSRPHLATSEPDYSAAQLAFLREVDRTKRALRRQFLTLTEIVECAERVGWHRPSGAWANIGAPDRDALMAS